MSFRVTPGKRQWRFYMGEEIIDVPISSCLSANSLSFLRTMALAGRGIIMMPIWMVRDDLKHGRLVTVLSEYSLDPRGTPINAVFAHNRHLAPKVRAFVEILAERVEDL